MDRRRAVAALLALAACIACSAAAPTANDHTALELSEGPSEGCYYNFQHYGEGDRIMTNEPCLNCTCHNRMLMCYLRVCPFTKPIGQDCTVEKRADQCCPIVTCPDVPVDLLTSTSTSSPAEYGTTGVGKQDRYGCSINGKYFAEGSKVPPTPNKPCEHCYCIRNMTTCVMQECTLHVDGCTPIYHKDVCCPVRYSCDHPEDEIPLLDDMTTTVRPTPGFLLTTTAVMPVTQVTQDCVHEDQTFPDGAHIKTEKACEHCYCMKGDIVCVVQGCGTPMENEGKNCTALPLRPGQCCPDTYICEGDEQGADLTTEIVVQTTTPPRRIGVEGSGYRHETGEPVTEINPFETDIEGSGDDFATTPLIGTISDVAIEKEPFITDEEILTVTTEKEVHTSQSTEADKGLNTIPDINLDKESSGLPEQDVILYTTEVNKEFVATTTDTKTTAFDTHPIEDIGNKDELVTTESVFRKEDSDITSDEILLHKELDKSTTPIVDLVDELPSKDEYGGDSSIDTAPKYEDKTTTEAVQYTNEYISTIKTEETSTEKQAEVGVTEKSKLDEEHPKETSAEENIALGPETVTTMTPGKLNLPETTSINTIINEIDESILPPGRIPGEGDCLLNGITYTNNTIVPSMNNCHTSCKCVSSIIKCDPIICSPPPEYMENMNDCQPMYDSPDSCCPTYVCSAKETIPPQSHSQMSGTESPKPISDSDCTGDACVLDEEKTPQSEPSTICTSDDCLSKPVEKPTTQTQVGCDSNNCDNIPQIPTEKPEACSGNECLVPHDIVCDGENCKNQPTSQIDKTREKDSEDDKDSVNYICDGKEGCEKPIDTVQDECTDEICRRKEVLPSKCSGTECEINNKGSQSPDGEEVPATEKITGIKVAATESPERDIDSIDVHQTEQPTHDVTQHSYVSEDTITTSDIHTDSPKLDSDYKPDQTELPTIQTEPAIVDENIANEENLETKSTQLPVTVTEETEQHVMPDHDISQGEHTKLEDSSAEKDTEEKVSTDKVQGPTVATEYTETTLDETQSPDLTPDEKSTEKTESLEMKPGKSTTSYIEFTTINYEAVTEKMEADKSEHASEETTLVQPTLPETTIIKEEDKLSVTTTKLPESENDKNKYDHDTDLEPDKNIDKHEQSFTTVPSLVTDTDTYDEEKHITIKETDTGIDSQTNIYTEKYTTPTISQVEINAHKDTSMEPQVPAQKPEISVIEDDIRENMLTTVALPETLVVEKKDKYEGLFPTTVIPDTEKDEVTETYEGLYTKPRLPVTGTNEATYGESHTSSDLSESYTTSRLPELQIGKEKHEQEEPSLNSELPVSVYESHTEMISELYTTPRIPETEKVTLEESHVVQTSPTTIIAIQTDKIQEETESPVINISYVTTTAEPISEPVVTSELPQDLGAGDQSENEIEVVSESNVITTIPTQEIYTSMHELTTKSEGDSDSVPVEQETKIPIIILDTPTTVSPTFGDLDQVTAGDKVSGIENTILSTEATKSDEIDSTKITESPATENLVSNVEDTLPEKESTVTVANSISTQETITETPEVQATSSEELLIDTNEVKQDKGYTESPYVPTTLTDSFVTNENVIEKHDYPEEVPLQSEINISDDSHYNTETTEKSTGQYSEQYTETRHESITEPTAKYTLADHPEIKQPVSTEAVTEKESEVPVADIEKSEEQITDTPDRVELAKPDSITTITQDLQTNENLFAGTTPKLVEIEDTTKEYSTMSFDIPTFDEKDHKPIEIEKPQEDTNDQKLTEQTTIYPFVEQKPDEAELQSATQSSFINEDVTPNLNLMTEEEKTPSAITESLMNTDKEQFETQTPEIFLKENVSKTTESPHSTHQPSAEDTVTEEIALKTTHNIDDEDIQTSFDVSTKQAESHTKLPDTITTESYISEDKDSVTELLEPTSIPDEKDEKDKNVNNLPENKVTTTSASLITEVVPEFTDKYLTFTEKVSDDLGSETESTKMTFDQTLLEEPRPATVSDVYTTETKKPISEVPESVVSHEYTDGKITTESIITSESTKPTPIQTTILPVHDEETDAVPKDSLNPNLSTAEYGPSEVTSERVSSTETEEVTPKTEEEKATLRPSDQEVPVFVQEEEKTTSVSSKVIETDGDKELSFTEIVPIKQQDYQTTYLEDVTEVSEKEKTTGIMTSEAITTDLSSATESTHVSDEMGFKDDDDNIKEDKTTETSISLEIKTSTNKIVDLITEKQEMLDHASTTTARYESVTEQKVNEIPISDVSTEAPEKITLDTDEITQLPEEIPTVIDYTMQDKTTTTPYDHSFDEKVTKHPDLSKIEPSSSAPEIDENSEITTISTDKVQEDKEIYKTPSQVENEEAATTEKITSHLPDSERSTDSSLVTEKYHEPTLTEDHKEITDIEYPYSETTPFSVELEEHTHHVVDEASTSASISEVTTTLPREPQEPERGDITSDSLNTVENEQEKKSSETTTKRVEDVRESVTNMRDHEEKEMPTTIPFKEDEITTEQIIPSTSSHIDELKKETSVQDEQLILTTSPKTIKEQEESTTEYSEIQQSSSVTLSADVTTEKDDNYDLKPHKPDSTTQTATSSEQSMEDTPKTTISIIGDVTSTLAPTSLDTEKDANYDLKPHKPDSTTETATSGEPSMEEIPKATISIIGDVTSTLTPPSLDTEKDANYDLKPHEPDSTTQTATSGEQSMEDTPKATISIIGDVTSTLAPTSLDTKKDANYDLKPHKPDSTEEAATSGEPSMEEIPKATISIIGDVTSTLAPPSLDTEKDANYDLKPHKPDSTMQTATSGEQSMEEIPKSTISIIGDVTSTLAPTSLDTEKDANYDLKPHKPDSTTETATSGEPSMEEIPKATTSKIEDRTSTLAPISLDKLPESEEKPVDEPANLPDISKPVFNEEPVEDIPSPDFPPSGSGGYGQEPDYVEEDQAFGPGTCRYGGKVYVSAQQIPRDDPCDFCFCFRSDIICLQQSCPPPIHGCHEEPIQGFCCPRYECPVSMATTLNVTTTTTTTTTTLPPHFLPHAYKGAAQRRGCQIKGHTYKVGEVVRASSGPCLHCTCGGDGQMKCDPKACTPEPMLRQMIAAAVSAKRRR